MGEVKYKVRANEKKFKKEKEILWKKRLLRSVKRYKMSQLKLLRLEKNSQLICKRHWLV